MLDGKWIPIEAELGGTKMAAGALSSFELAIRNGTYEVPGDVGRIEVHEGTSPAAMDVIGTDGPNKGKTFPAIYELDEDLLTICYDLAGKERPTSFSTASGTKQFLVKYKRKIPTVTPPAVA